MVTLIKNSKTYTNGSAKKPDLKDFTPDMLTTKKRRPRKSAAEKNTVEDAKQTSSHAKFGEARNLLADQKPLSHLVARGKDLISGDASSIATTAAIFIGVALIEAELIPGLVIGAGAILLGKLFPEMGNYVRPAVKAAISAGFFISQKAREVVAEASEQVHDLVAEVASENAKPKAAKNTNSVAKPVADSQPTA